REDPAQLDDAIETWRAALRYRPADVALLLRLSRAASLRARTSSDGNKLADDAVAYAERALCADNQKLCERASDGKHAPDHVFNQALLADVPALIAYADALYDWSEKRGNATFLMQHDWIFAAADRARQ